MSDITHYRNIANNKYSHENELASALNECLDEIERLRAGVPDGCKVVTNDYEEQIKKSLASLKPNCSRPPKSQEWHAGWKSCVNAMVGTLDLYIESYASADVLRAAATTPPAGHGQWVSAGWRYRHKQTGTVTLSETPRPLSALESEFFDVTELFARDPMEAK